MAKLIQVKKHPRRPVEREHPLDPRDPYADLRVVRPDGRRVHP
jgi:hypothetical protein